MKHPAAAAAVLALHLLGLLALAAARPPAAAPDRTLAQRPATPAVLRVSLHMNVRSEALPSPRPAVTSPSPAPRRTAAAVAVSALTSTPAPTTAPAPVTEAVAETAAAATIQLAATIQTTTPPPPPAVTAAPTPEPPLTLAQADRRDCPPATHPAALRERGIEGEVRLLVRVGADGRAAEVRLQQPSGWRLFDHAALAQAQACRFVPARRGVQAVESWVEFPVRFSLRG